MKRILLSLYVIILCTSQQIPAAQHVASRPTNQQEQIPSQEEIKEFFDAARRQGINNPHQKVFDLLQKYGKNIINERSSHGDHILQFAIHVKPPFLVQL